MVLSKEDTERLESAGFNPEDFAVTCRDGLTKLRNAGEWRSFCDPKRRNVKSMSVSH